MFIGSQLLLESDPLIVVPGAARTVMDLPWVVSSHCTPFHTPPVLVVNWPCNVVIRNRSTAVPNLPKSTAPCIWDLRQQGLYFIQHMSSGRCPVAFFYVFSNLRPAWNNSPQAFFMLTNHEAGYHDLTKFMASQYRGPNLQPFYSKDTRL